MADRNSHKSDADQPHQAASRFDTAAATWDDNPRRRR